MPFVLRSNPLLVAALIAPLAGCASLPGATRITEQPLTLSGELTTRSAVNVNDGSRYHSFALQLEGGEVVEVRQKGEFGSQLTLIDDQQRLVSGPSASGSLALAPPSSGRYLLSLSGDSARRFGPFSLELARVNVRNGGELVSGERLAGLLKSGEGNRYQLQISEPAIYSVRMNSDTLDSVLHLEGEGQRFENDDADDGTNSRIEAYLEPGSYQVTARALDEQPTGIYLLSVEKRALPAGVELRNGGRLEPNSTLKGLVGNSPLSYQLQLEQASLVTLQMSSRDLDAHLQLTGNGVEASDDDGAGEGTDALLSLVLEPGRYQLQASGVDSRTGIFDLSYEAQPMPRGELSALRPGQYANGMLRGNEVVARLQISRAGSYQIDLASSAFDPLLQVSGADVDVQDDDSGGGRNARVHTHLEPGEYRLRVRGVDQPSHGRFRLSVIERP